MSPCRPRIGVTGPDLGGGIAWFFTRWALFFAGAKAIRITPSRGMPKVPIDGLVLGGGADVDPALYGHTAEDLKAMKGDFSILLLLLRLLFAIKPGRSHGLDKDRDTLEMAALAQAIAHDVPVLGICRGAQLINVHFGGTLNQNLEHFYEERPQPYGVLARKAVRVRPESRLANILGVTELTVNSLHRQAVDALGKDVIASAVEANGVVQAIEHVTHDLVIGVQWHPEYLPQRAEQRALFRSLVAAACCARDRRAEEETHEREMAGAARGAWSHA